MIYDLFHVNSSNVGKFFWSWILKDHKIPAKKKKVIVSRSRPPQGNKALSRRSCAVTARKHVQKRAKEEFVLLIWTWFDLKLFCRSRCRRLCLSSLLLLLPDGADYNNPGVVVCLTFTLMYEGIISHSFITCKLHLSSRLAKSPTSVVSYPWKAVRGVDNKIFTILQFTIMKYKLCKKPCTKIQLVVNFGSSAKLKQPVMYFSNNYISDMATPIFRQVEASASSAED